MTAQRRKLGIILGITIAVALLVLANVHLVYVATTSQPDCVPHLKSPVLNSSGEANGNFRAARSSC
jgi:hypothetical protein